MTRTTLVLLTLLAGCAVADADESAALAPVPASPMATDTTPSPVPTWDGLTRDELVRVDARGSAMATALVLEDVRALSPQQRLEASKALASLQVDCPFNRTSVQLPLAMEQVVREIPAETLPPLYATDWEYLQRGLATHVAILDALGADLPAPRPGDYLHRKTNPGVMLDRTALAASENPVAATMPLIGWITLLVENYDDDTTDRITSADLRVRDATGQQWPLKPHLMGWRDTLMRVQPAVTHPETQARITEMLDALDRYLGTSC